MTVQELITYLQTLPPETLVSCVEVNSRGYETYGKMVPLTDELLDFSDLMHIPYPERQRCYLRIGSI